MTKEIPLTQGQVALVDDWRFDELSQYKWCAHWANNMKSFYATRTSYKLSGKQVTIRMHAVVAGTPKGFHTDHINHDTLDNQEHNLRVCSASQNSMNKSRRADSTSGYKGVSRHGRVWQAQIRFNGELRYLGTWSTPELAAVAYDAAAKELYGEFASLNFKEG